VRDKKIKTPESFIKINKESDVGCSFKIKRLRNVYLRNNELLGGEKQQEGYGLASAQNAETFLIK